MDMEIKERFSSGFWLKQLNELTPVNLSDVVEDIFLVLTPKEKEVVIKRFALDNKPKMTLEKIGQSFSVTRERVRQIEKIALSKLRRTSSNTKFSLLNKIATEIIDEYGGILIEKKLINEVIKLLGKNEVVDVNILKLAFSINPEVEKIEKINVFEPFWKKVNFSFDDLKLILDFGIKILNSVGDVVSFDFMIKEVMKELSTKIKIENPKSILSIIEVDKRVKVLGNGFGLVSWRHINPRSIRDKAYIVMKEAGEPLHFIEIANRISAYGFDKKVVTIQAVHNELIRYDKFVLVGRGLYALKEWGYKKGTVSEIIEGLLNKKSPMTKQEIIQGVLKQRKVKKGTISLNLQKNPKFVRVGRAVYTLKAS